MSIENAGIVLSILKPGKIYSIEELKDQSGLTKIELFKIINTLKDVGLCQRSNGNEVQLVDNINAVTIARAAQEGISLMEFKDDLNISSEQIELAIEITEKIDVISKINISGRGSLLQQRGYLVLSEQSKVSETYKNLVNILETVNSLFIDYLKNIAVEDKILDLLLVTHESAERELRKYVESEKGLK